MFTGLVENTAKLVSVSSTELRLYMPDTKDKADKLGDSISINGVCLTLKKISSFELSFDISHETLYVSNLGSLKPGDQVNIERALSVSERLHGHFVTGHVDMVARVKEIKKNDKYWDIYIQLDGEEPFRWASNKGAICINGVSLTINELIKPNTLKLTLIPHTLDKTNLINFIVGDKVNVEFDILSKYLESLILNKKNSSGNLTEEKLRELGYVR